MKQYRVILIVETEEGNPAKWDWSDLIGDYAGVESCKFIQDITDGECDDEDCGSE